MSSDRWWWANKARELRFQQLEAARKQAETWRTGLAGLTSLVGAVLLVKGRENFSALSQPYSVSVAVLLGLAVATLVLATLRALRAASGAPGDECLLTGEDLEIWTRGEVVKVQSCLTVAQRLTIGGFCLLVCAIGLTWFAPTQQQAGPVVTVESDDGTVCGELIGVGDGTMIVRGSDEYRVLSLRSIHRLTPKNRCR